MRGPDAPRGRPRAAALAAAVAALAGALPVGPARAAPLCASTNVTEAAVQALRRDAARRGAPAPRAIAELHTEGSLPHQHARDEALEARQDLPLMRELALLWHLRQDRPALARLAPLLDAWAAAYRPSFNPIDETGFDGLIDAYALAGANLPADTRARTATLLRAWADGYLAQMQHPATPAQKTGANNWQSHRVKLATLAAAALGDDALFAQAREQFRLQVGRNLQPDGRSIDFDERDALHYVVYDLEPLARAALAARLRGEDWLHLAGANGATLAAGIDWLGPYARGERVHEEFRQTSVAFDRQRRDAGVAGFAGPWDPKGAAMLYGLASRLDDRYRPLALALGPPAPWLAACGAPPDPPGDPR